MGGQWWLLRSDCARLCSRPTNSLVLLHLLNKEVDVGMVSLSLMSSLSGLSCLLCLCGLSGCGGGLLRFSLSLCTACLSCSHPLCSAWLSCHPQNDTLFNVHECTLTHTKIHSHTKINNILPLWNVHNTYTYTNTKCTRDTHAHTQTQKHTRDTYTHKHTHKNVQETHTHNYTHANECTRTYTPVYTHTIMYKHTKTHS